jgi:hypothetical protein
VGLISVFYFVCMYQLCRIWIFRSIKNWGRKLRGLPPLPRNQHERNEEDGSNADEEANRPTVGPVDDTVLVYQGRVVTLSEEQRRAVLEAIFSTRSKVNSYSQYFARSPLDSFINFSDTLVLQPATESDVSSQQNRRKRRGDGGGYSGLSTAIYEVSEDKGHPVINVEFPKAIDGPQVPSDAVSVPPSNYGKPAVTDHDSGVKNSSFEQEQLTSSRSPGVEYQWTLPEKISATRDACSVGEAYDGGSICTDESDRDLKCMDAVYRRESDSGRSRSESPDHRSLPEKWLHPISSNPFNPTLTVPALLAEEQIRVDVTPIAPYRLSMTATPATNLGPSVSPRLTLKLGRTECEPAAPTPGVSNISISRDDSGQESFSDSERASVPSSPASPQSVPSMSNLESTVKEPLPVSPPSLDIAKSGSRPSFRSEETGGTNVLPVLLLSHVCSATINENATFDDLEGAVDACERPSEKLNETGLERRRSADGASGILGASPVEQTDSNLYVPASLTRRDSYTTVTSEYTYDDESTAFSGEHVCPICLSGYKKGDMLIASKHCTHM